MTIAYKLLRPDLTTHAGCQWVVGVEKETTGEGELCGPGWLHAYTHPLLAVALNPIHANIDTPVLYKVEAGWQCKTDYGLKVGYTRMRLLEPMALPALTTEQLVRFAIRCSLHVYADPAYAAWAKSWLNGTDRTEAAAWAAGAAARAAGAAEAAARAAWAARAAARAAGAAEAAAWAAEAAAWAAWAAWAARAAAGAAEAAAGAAEAAAGAAAEDTPLNLIAAIEWACSE